jgi:hypothetical protein
MSLLADAGEGATKMANHPLTWLVNLHVVRTEEQ